MAINQELYEAAGNGYTIKVRELIAKGANVNSRHGYYQGLALHNASHNGHGETVKELLLHKAEKDVKDIYGNTPLHEAAEMGHTDVIKILAENRCRSDLKNKDGDAPIHVACIYNNFIITKILLKHGHPTDIQNKSGNTPLHIACRNNNLDLVKTLLENGCRTDIENDDGRTAFDMIENEQKRKAVDNLHKDITRKKLPGIPQEIQLMNRFSIDLFIDAMNNKKQKIFHIRIMVVGQFGVGKSTFTIGLLNDDSIPYEPGSTNGISIYVGRCRIGRSDGKWHVGDIVRKRGSIHHDKVIKILRNVSTEEIEDKYKEEQYKDLAVIDKEKPELTRIQEEQFDCPKDEYADNVEISSIDSDALSNERVNNTKHSTAAQKKDCSVEPPLIAQRQMLLETVEYSKTNEESPKEFVDVEMWDFGGQDVFYTSHQTFLSGRCIYTLLVDLSTFSEEYQKAYLDFWINTIIIYAKGKRFGFPKIILVGTHLDKIPVDERKSRTNSIFVRIWKEFSGHPAEPHLIIDPEFCLNANDKNDPAYEKIRTKLYEVSESYPTWGEERPAYWIPLEKSLLELRDRDQKKIISVEVVKEKNEESPCRKLTEKEIPVFLEFHNSLGSWLYFKEESLNKFVILDPKWLIDALSSIITDKTFCESDALKMKIWTSLTEKGSLHTDLVHELWKREKYAEFGRYEDHLLRTMEKFDLLVKPKLYQDDGEEDSADVYFIPCMLETKVPSNIKRNLHQTEGAKLIFEFEGRFLPQAIFFRLIGSCIKMWPILEINGKRIIYSTLVAFEVDDFQHMYLQKLDDAILLKFEPVNPECAVSRCLCEGIRKSVEETLNRVVETYDCYKKTPENEDIKMQIFTTKIPCCSAHMDCLTDINTYIKEEKLHCEHHIIEDIKNTLFPCSGSKDIQLKRMATRVDCGSNCKGLEGFLLHKEIPEVDLARVARRLSPEPGSLAAYLNMWNEWRFIDDDRYYGTYEKIFHLLLKWKNIQRANFGKLQREIKEFGETVNSDFNHLLCNVMKVNDRYKEDPDYEFLPRDEYHKITSKFLNELADRLLLKDGYQLCLELGISASELDRIRCNYPNQSAMHIREGLHAWKLKQQTDSRKALFDLSVALDEVGIGNGPLRDVLEGCFSKVCSNATRDFDSTTTPSFGTTTDLFRSSSHQSALAMSGIPLREGLLRLELEKAHLEINKLKEEIKLIQLKQKFYEAKLDSMKS